VLYVVLPCYNETEVLPQTAEVLLALYGRLLAAGAIAEASRIVFVEGGSTDGTWQLIERLSAENPLVQGVKCARNDGHQNAVLAGYLLAKDLADAVVSMDADLQDDAEAIAGMLEEFKAGHDVVYGVRSSRAKDSVMKRWSARAYYRMMQRMGVDIVYDHADFRLLSSRACEALSQFGEVNLFLRGMVPLLGYTSAVVYYERQERAAGTSKYSVKKLVSFAMQGVTSFSAKPLRMISYIGVLMIVLAAIALTITVVSWVTGHAPEGWPSMLISLWLIGGALMISIGIVGEYIGKIFLEVKQRPRYIVEDATPELAEKLED